MDTEKKPINEMRKRTINDYLDVETAKGMPGIVDSTVALDFLLAVKTGIRNCAASITETASPDARKFLRDLLDQTVELHAELSELMMNKGWLHPYQVNEQFQIDKASAQTALQIAGLNLFPGDTSRLGTFATPNY
ncbi:MAG: spore coat protein [Clostridia bacterium]|nr:spore coat protein [Clostridia bacterium]